MSDTAEEWQVAGRRKGTARRRVQQPLAAPACQEQTVVDTEKTIQRIRDTMSDLRCEEFWKEWKERLTVTRLTDPSEPSATVMALSSETPDSPSEKNTDGRRDLEQHCVCYGLGSFSSCVSARYQLAMLLLLLDTLQIPLKDCSVYDPMFSSGERDVLRALGLTIITENEEGKRLTTKPTLFYLMHCGKALYNNLLWKNWSRETLPQLTIIGNSFSGIQDRMIEREFQRDYSYIAQAVVVCEERPLPCPSRLLDVFNDTVVISFPSSGLSKLPQCTWTQPPEPRYEHCGDLEIILREQQR